MTTAPVPRGVLLTLCGIQFTHLLDFAVMMPLGPQLTQRFGLSDAQFGALVSAYSFAAAASGLVALLYVDRHDRKRMLLAAYALFTLATLACALAGSYEQLLATRLAAGAFGGVLSAQIQTIVADLVPYRQRGSAMALVMSAYPLSTVFGVPLSLAMAAYWGWAFPFAAIAGLSVVLMAGAWIILPAISGHLEGVGPQLSARARIRDSLVNVNHRRAFAFTALLMLGGSTVVPFITLYMQANVGLVPSQIPYLYFFGGLGALLGASLIGSMADRYGALRVFRVMAVLALPLVFALTLLPPAPLIVVLCVSTPFFLCMSGRMIPGMAIVQSVPGSQARGTFMTLNATVQMAAMGAAAFVGGQIIGRDAQGHVQNYGWVALVSAAAGVAGIWLAGRIILDGAQSTSKS